ncbi:NAD(P)/FAD-dependent oxidoreductase [Melittangium boletus]|uniref:NADH:ubiquinone reductase (non-electrogenic) n=1 Tax=Melittangium boletus DSM 14713 TaxID=1294270 RepID=A0A250IG79_9BACT|nr:NAD(P)/FAD-dependent oxidoreductase [Melittangium boletus]ATB30258.1 NADH dehydrogenase [Melittangium boletus DSM 14713]
MESNRDVHHVVVVGAGFGGLEAARKLGKAKERVKVTVVDRYNHHLFQPLLYQVATAVLSPADISAPIRHILRGKNTQVLLAEARSVDTARKVLVCDGGELAYDSLVLATGATHSYFNHPEWSKIAPGLKTLNDAVAMRERILLALEAAERETDPERQREWLTFVIIGAGPTGVELAGALSYMTRHSLPKDFRRIDTRKARVILLEGLPRVLSQFSEKLSEDARRDLEKLGVEVRTGSMVSGVDEQGVSIGEERIPTRTVLWGAGVAASPLMRSLGAPLDKAGRVKVDASLTLSGHPDVYVIGDVASLQQDGKPVPGIAPAAMQMGRHVAKSILERLAGKPPEPFHYVDKGSFAVIGRGYAVGTMFGKVPLSGFLAWALWAGVHIAYLVGFRNRLAVMLNWFFTFMTRGRDVRLITGAYAPRLPPFSPTAEPPGDGIHAGPDPAHSAPPPIH